MLFVRGGCPSNCIYIEAAENTDKVRISGGERYAKVYNIDYNRCIFCGYCVEACPTDAITHGHGFEVASFNTATLIFRKEQCWRPFRQGPGRRRTPTRAYRNRLPYALAWASFSNSDRQYASPQPRVGHGRL